MVRWVAAFQAYALAAEAAEVRFRRTSSIRIVSFESISLQVWSYTAAMAHLRICLEIAAKAASEEKRYSLAIIYDELCRKEWHQKANRGILNHSCTPNLGVLILRLCMQETAVSM